MKRYTFWECRERRGELPAFESGELAPERAERLAAHLAVCARCRTEWEILSGVASLLRAEPPLAASPAPDLWSRIESEILEPVPAPAPTPAWRRPAFALSLSGAAMAALAAVAVPRLVTPPNSGAMTPAPLASPAPTPAPSPVEVAKVDKIEVEPPPVIYKEPTPAPVRRPAPVRKPSSPRRARPAGRLDPFEPVLMTSHARRRPLRRPAAPPVVALAAAPEDSAPVSSGAETTAKAAESRPGETVIPAAKPDPAKTALRDARTEGESAERRSAAAMEPPLDAVERASRARRLFP